MAIQRLEHFLIQTADMAATRDWYVEVLGLTPGPAPEFHFPVCWLYVGDVPVLHLAEGGDRVPEARKAYLGQQSTAVRGSGVIDHVAFNATDLAGTLERFRRLGIDCSTRRNSETGQVQVFVLDPNDVKVELNFAPAEAGDVEIGLSTEELTSR